MKPRLGKRLLGMSLLEILLVLTIGASIILLSVRYFNVTTRHIRVEQAMTEIKLLTDASYEWLRIQRQANFNNDTNHPAVSLEELIQVGLVIPNSQKKATALLDPWGGEIKIMPAEDPNYVKISLSNIPAVDCKNLRHRLESINHSTILTLCNQRKNIFYGVF